MTRRIAFFAYGVLSYALFLGVFLYAIGFVGGFGVPKGLDSEPTMAFWPALGIDLLLLGLFAVQHSVMARPAFKRAWTRFVPEPVERSTYVLFSNVAMILLFWLWQPLGGEVWTVENPAARALIYGVYALGWLIVLVSTFLIDHFDLFGLRQVWLHLRGREYTPLRFQMHTAYRFVRHPIYVGWLLIFWATPTMTASHLVFALLSTAYILVGIRLEERDLVRQFGDRYLVYRREVPSLVPRLRREPAASFATGTDTA